MDFTEKLLYHQIHPAKLAADITGSLISTYLMWRGKFGPAMLTAFVPAILASVLVVRFADLERLKQSPFGHYIGQFMTGRIEAWRFAGQVVMWVGAWYHHFWLILVGVATVITAWMSGRWRRNTGTVL
jgi:hypothetical protein